MEEFIIYTAGSTVVSYQINDGWTSFNDFASFSCWSVYCVFLRCFVNTVVRILTKSQTDMFVKDTPLI